jgi:WD40 repeat protein
VRTWDVYDSKSQLEVLQHSHDVLALAWRPDGRQLAAATLDGQIYLWAPADGVLEGVIEGRRDIKGGRLASDRCAWGVACVLLLAARSFGTRPGDAPDAGARKHRPHLHCTTALCTHTSRAHRRAAGNLSSGAAFTSLAFSADGALLFAGGRSKYVCVYDVAERVLLRRFQVSGCGVAVCVSCRGGWSTGRGAELCVSVCAWCGSSTPCRRPHTLPSLLPACPCCTARAQVTHNRSLDGVLDQLNSKNLTDAGPLQLIDHDDAGGRVCVAALASDTRRVSALTLVNTQATSCALAGPTPGKQQKARAAHTRCSTAHAMLQCSCAARAFGGLPGVGPASAAAKHARHAVPSHALNSTSPVLVLCLLFCVSLLSGSQACGVRLACMCVLRPPLCVARAVFSSGAQAAHSPSCGAMGLCPRPSHPSVLF